MSKSKTSKASKPAKTQKPAPRAPAQPPADSPPDAASSEASPTLLTADDMAFLRRVHLFLFNIPKYLERARRNGYTQEEHDLGWELWTTASGKNRRFEHWIAETEQKGQLLEVSSERKRQLEEIDAFENRWFPRMRMIIARYLPKEKAAKFASAFFNNLSQQPLSPAVVDSVKTFLKRIDEVETSSDPDIRKLRKTLTERGLTVKTVKAMRELIAAAEAFKPVATTAPPVSPEEIAEAKEAQLKALESLKLWYNDWATTFRDVLGTRDQITLGLTTIKRRAQDDDAGDAEEGDALDEEDAGGEPDEEGGEPDDADADA